MAVAQYTFLLWMCLLGIAGTGLCREDGQGILLYTMEMEIRKLSLGNGEDISVIETGKHRIAGVAFPGNASTFYWSYINFDAAGIMLSSLDGERTEVIADLGLLAPEKLVVDWITGNIYFIDRLKKRIGVCTANGLYCTVLITSSVLDEPGSLVLHPGVSAMFWSDTGRMPSIWTAGMDGKEAGIILARNLGRPEGLAIDHANDRLYWINTQLDTIESAALDGGHRIRHARKSGERLHSLAILADTLYWSSWKRNTIESMDVYTGSTTLVNASGLIYDMEIYHPSLKLPWPNRCHSNKCEQICLPAQKSNYTCACSLNQVLGPDLRTCRTKVGLSYLAIAAGDRIIYYRGETLGKARIEQTPMKLHIGQIVYNRITGNFICDIHSIMSLSSFDPRKNKFQLMETSAYTQYVGGIDIDYTSDTISFSIPDQRRIYEISLFDATRSYQNFADEPLAILSLPGFKQRLVVFKSDSGDYGIHWLHFKEPRRRMILVAGLVGPRISLAYDRIFGRVYFADEGAGKIESFALDSGCWVRGDNCFVKRHLVYSGVNNPVSLAILDRKVYWTMRDSTTLQWVEINDPHHVVKSTVLPIRNNHEIMDIVAVENNSA